MGSKSSNGGDRILAVHDSVMTLADLPPKTLRRWVARRKADVIAAVEGGLLTQSDACARYNISREEFSTWLVAFEADGLPGLRAKAIVQGRRVRDEAPEDKAFHAAPELILHTGVD